MAKGITLLIMVLALGVALKGQAWKHYPHTPEGSHISFPADEGWHPGTGVEWWYVSGHLTGLKSGIPYSFMLSYFYYPAYGFDGFRVLNICRDDTGEFWSDAQGLLFDSLGTEGLYISATLMNDTSEYWHNRKDQEDQTLPFEYELAAKAGSGSLQLGLNATKNPLILGDSGLFLQGSSSMTWYYSLTDLEVTGKLRFGQDEEEVAGRAWMDKQYGSFNPSSGEQYEWLSIKLDDGTDLVLWDLFTPQMKLPGTPPWHHMSIWEHSASQYTSHDFHLERLAYAFMPDEGMCYAQKWRLKCDRAELDLVIESLNPHWDVFLPFRFWEGATRVSGTHQGSAVSGSGFAELVKSYEAPGPYLLYPLGGTWKDSLMIAWMIENPDDGLKLKYALEYRRHNDPGYTSIATGLDSMKYTWIPPSSLERGDMLWFRITAYSLDSTLAGSITSEQASVYLPDTTTHIGYSRGSAASLFRAYPLPAGEFLNVESGKPYSVIHYRLTDTGGREWISGSVRNPGKQFRIDLDKIEAGIYLLWISGEGDTQSVLPVTKL